MYIRVLMENTTASPDLTAEHGLSLYIETGSHKILFDTGKTGAFADNARVLGVNLSEVELCVLSHGHYDHGGGISRFLSVNSHAPVYASCHAFTPCYSSGSYIGLDPALRGNKRIISVGDTAVLFPGITLHSCNRNPRPYVFGTFGQTIPENERQIPDPYLHEQYLLIEENGKRICISGCSHKGALNILHWFRPDVFIGGFHFIRMDPDGSELAAAAELLARSDTMYYTGHCTGQAQFDTMKGVLGSRLEYIHTGSEIRI